MFWLFIGTNFTQGGYDGIMVATGCPKGLYKLKSMNIESFWLNLLSKL